MRFLPTRARPQSTSRFENVLRLVALLVTALAFTGCEDDGSGSRPSMDEMVSSIEELPSVEKVVRLTEDNDPNDLIGRPYGYDHAAVFVDSRLECGPPGVDCGAFLEVWGDAEEAKHRSEYIQALQKGAPMLGTEFHYLDGPMLLRVNGELGPSAADEYEQAFTY